MHILWIKTELLHPVDKGGRIRTYNMLRELRLDHRITYLTLDDGTAAHDAEVRAREYCDELERIPFATPAKGSAPFFVALARNLLSSLPYAVAKYRSEAMENRIRDVVRRATPDVLVCDFLFPAINVPDGLSCPTVLFQHNVEAMIWRRHAEVAAGALKRRYFLAQWRRMARVEAEQCRRFDVVVAVSESDATTFRREYGVRHALGLPTGVDTTYFTPEVGGTRSDHELVFTGSLDWMPNEDGLSHFIEQVLPLVHAELPRVSLTVVGRNPPSKLLALARRSGAVAIVGRVPDVRPFLSRAALSIVPLRVGGGTRLKIYEAMAMECPVVSTTIGAEGLPVRDGEHLAIADAPAEFARSIVDLLRDSARRRALAINAAEYVRREFGWRVVANQFAAICAAATRGTDGEGVLASLTDPSIHVA